MSRRSLWENCIGLGLPVLGRPGRKLLWCLGLLLVFMGSVWSLAQPQVSSTPSQASLLTLRRTQPTLLILSLENDQRLAWLKTILDDSKTPYDVWQIPQDSFDWAQLVKDDEGVYRGIILTDAKLTAVNRPWALSADELELLRRYEHDFDVRQLILHYDPSTVSEDFGIRFAFAKDTSKSAVSLIVTAAGAERLSGFMQGHHLLINQGYIYMSRLEPAEGTTLIPLLTDVEGYSLATLSVTEDDRERLLFTMMLPEDASYAKRLLKAALGWVARTPMSAAQISRVNYPYLVIIIGFSLFLLFTVLLISFRRFREQRDLRALYQDAEGKEPEESRQPLKNPLSQLD